ncbi:hypothetical protein ACRALDRAFT_210404 [Sodiomyces alcalophilus JCM 7366]|uniref:uncharacterized protein n=1 Tax=Sodiomyces alcalophilus JCM 7366 TaxID=591952 RepID=UPI0039B4BE11
MVNYNIVSTGFPEFIRPRIWALARETNAKWSVKEISIHVQRTYLLPRRPAYMRVFWELYEVRCTYGQNFRAAYRFLPGLGANVPMTPLNYLHALYVVVYLYGEVRNNTRGAKDIKIADTTARKIVCLLMVRYSKLNLLQIKQILETKHTTYVSLQHTYMYEMYIHTSYTTPSKIRILFVLYVYFVPRGYMVCGGPTLARPLANCSWRTIKPRNMERRKPSRSSPVRAANVERRKAPAHPARLQSED